MISNKIIKKFSEENPQIPNYILEEVETLIPNNIKDSDLNKILENVLIEYEDSTITPNEAIGIITAQSIGEPSTQMTLNTFHFAGVGTKSVVGLPRLIEILDGKKNLLIPTMEIYLKKQGMTDNKFKLTGDKIRETRISEVSTTVDLDLEEKLVKVDLNTKNLKRLKIEFDYIISKLDTKIRKSASIENNKTLVVKGTPNSTLKDLRGIKELILKTVVSGIKGITEVTLVKEADDFLIITRGVALKQILNMEGIDETRIYSNDIHQIGEVFGIEAARSVIIKEIGEVISSQGLSINERHILLIADIMTFTGEVKGMTRYGIVAEKMNVMTKASFETTVKHIANGALMNEANRLTSITENVMTNQMINVGTGMIKIAVKERN